MSHQIIITTPASGSSGGSRSSNEVAATATLSWSPSHDLTPNQQARRIERAQAMLDKIAEMLTAEPREE